MYLKGKHPISYHDLQELVIPYVTFVIDDHDNKFKK